MADSTSLIMQFSTPDGEKNFTYRYADPDARTEVVKAAANALIANGSIFENPPIELKSAYTRTISEDHYDISD